MTQQNSILTQTISSGSIKDEKLSTFNTWGQEVSCLSSLISPNDCVNSIIKAVPERIRIQVLCLTNRQNHTKIRQKGFMQHSERSKIPQALGVKNLRICLGVHDFFSFENNKRKLLLPFLVLLSCRTVRVIDDPNQTGGVQQSKSTKWACLEKRGETEKTKMNPEPENLLNDGSSNGLVALAVPSPSDTLVRPWPWPRHLQQQQPKKKKTLLTQEEQYGRKKKKK